MFCDKCGAKLEEGTIYCGNCGHSMVKENDEPSIDSVSEVSAGPEPQAEEHASVEEPINAEETEKIKKKRGKSLLLSLQQLLR